MFDLATAKARLGVTDAAQDAAITTALNGALALAERYCDRGFFFNAETARFFRPTSSRLVLRRYPVARVLSVLWTGVGELLPYQLQHEAGIVVLGCGWPTGPWPGTPTLEVAYEGGYKVLPADLELALWMTFDAVWLATPGAGAAAGANVSPGAVRSFSIDGMSLTYSESGKGNASGHDGGAWGLMPASAIAALDPYRAETVAGGA